MPTGVSIFDLDRTLTRNGTYSPFLLYAARVHCPWRLMFVPVVLAAMIAYKLRLLRRKQLKELMHRLMIGANIDRQTITHIAERFADRLLETNVYPQARALIDRERAQGRVLILATAAHRFYAAPIAARLGIHHVVATESTWRGDHLTPRISGSNCHSSDKLAHIIEYLDAAGIKRSECRLRFLSDDLSDRTTFEWCDEPIAVNPSLRLRQLAMDRGWSRLDWRQ